MTARHGALDELRGLAVLVVFLSHAANDGLLPGWLGDGAGQLGVQIFFMLSGFLMLRLYGARPLTPGRARDFLLARAGRILPVYWLVLAVSALAGAAGWAVHYQVAEGSALAAAAGLVVAPQELWSVPVEAQFYLIFLALWAAIGAGGGWRAALVWLVPAALLLAAAFRGGVSELALAPAFAPAFLIGMWLAVLPVPPALGRGAAPWVALGLLVVNLPGLRGAWGLELWEGFYPGLWLDPFRLGAAALLLASAAAAPGRWLLGRPLAALGIVSYGFYLFHRPILRALGPVEAPGWALALLAFTVCAALATLSWRGLEKPAAARIRGWRVPRRRPARQPAAR